MNEQTFEKMLSDFNEMSVEDYKKLHEQACDRTKNSLENIITNNNFFIEKLIKENEEMKSMIDEVYELVEIWGYKSKEESPYNYKWSKEWLEKARKFGASGEW